MWPGVPTSEWGLDVRKGETSVSDRFRINSLLWMLLLIGFGIRALGIDFGFPYDYHMEEPAYSSAAWHLACLGNPDSPLLQPHTLLSAIGIWLMRVLQEPGVCSASFELTPGLLLLERLISAGLGTATIAVVYRLGRLLYASHVGLIGAACITLNFLHVRESHHGTPDVVALFLGTMALWAYARIGRYGRTKDYLAAAVFSALSIVGRPTASLLMLPFAFAHVQRHGGLRNLSRRNLQAAFLSGRLWASLCVMGATFLMSNVQLLINPIGYLKYWYSFLKLSDRIRYLSDPLPAPLFYIRTLEWAGGALLVIAMGVGLLWALRQRTYSDLLLVSFIIPYFVLGSASSVYFARYALPIMPGLSLLAARLVEAVPQLRRRPVWLVPVLAVFLLQPGLRIVRYDYLLLQTDTRTLAKEWIEENVPPNAKIAMEWHGPHLSDRSATVVDFYGLSEDSLPNYRQAGYEYLVVSSFIRDFHLAAPAEDRRKREFYASLAQQAEVVAQFKPYSGTLKPPYYLDQSLGPITSLFDFERPGPTIEIYRLSDNSR